MSVKFSNTTADYLEWSEALNLIHKLSKEKKYTISLLVACGIFFGLRISDLLNLKWIDLLNTDTFELREKKTGKKRIVKINEQLQKHITECYQLIKPQSINDFCFMSASNKVYSIQRLNVILKELKHQYSLNIEHISTHSFRKTFGRRVYDLAGTNSEHALVRLSELFNHSTIQITRRYLGLKNKELMEVYDSLTF